MMFRSLKFDVYVVWRNDKNINILVCNYLELYFPYRHIHLIFGGNIFNIQSTLVISNSKGLTETLRDIRTSTYQS